MSKTKSSEFETLGGKFTFCCGDYVKLVDTRGTVTSELLDMLEEDERIIYVLNDAVGRDGRCWR